MALFAFDMDGVLVNFAAPLLNEYNRLYNTNYVTDDMKSQSVIDSFGEDVGAKMEMILNERGFFQTLKPFDGALKVVETLLDVGHIIEICTTAPSYNCPSNEPANGTIKRINPVAAHDKIMWIHKYLPELSRNVTITRNKHLMRADVLVDDTPKNIINWCKVNPNGLGFVVNQPWNESMALPSNAVRGKLEDILRIIGNIKPDNSYVIA